MSLPSLETIKRQREKLHISQKKLATMTGVSTSMINQIESGRSKPSYDTAKKIFENLAILEGESSSHVAGEICKTPVEKMKPTQTINDAIKKMYEMANEPKLFYVQEYGDHMIDYDTELLMALEKFIQSLN